MPVKVVSGRIGNTEIRVRNTWFGGIRLYINDREVAHDRRVFLSPASLSKPLLSVTETIDGQQRKIEVFFGVSWRVKIKICVDGAYLAGDDFDPNRTKSKVAFATNRFANALAIAILGWFTSAAAVNWIDDNPSADLQTILSRPAPAQIPPEQNTFYDLVGIYAKDGDDPHAWGVAWYAQADAIEASQDRGTGKRPAVEQTQRTAPIKSEDLPCASGTGCLVGVQKSPTVAKQALEAEAVVLARLDAMLDRDVQEPYRTVVSYAEIPKFSLIVMRTYKLARIRFAQSVASGDYRGALSCWSREAAFLGRAMANATTLVAKMSFVAALREHQRLLADFVSVHPEWVHSNRPVLLSALPALSTPTTSFATVLEDEVRGSYPIFKSVAEDGKSWFEQLFISPFYSPVASLESHAELIQSFVKADALAGERYRIALAAAQRDVKAAQPAAWQNFSIWRNAVGAFVVGASAVDWAPYFYRRDTVLAERAMLRFVIEQLRDGAIDEAALTKEKLSAAGVIHPYTGDTPVWDPTTRQLKFTLPDESSAKELAQKQGVMQIAFPSRSSVSADNGGKYRMNIPVGNVKAAAVVAGNTEQLRSR